MIRRLTVASLSLALLACDTGNKPAETAKSLPKDIQKPAAETSSGVTKAVASSQEKAKEVVASAKEAVTEAAAAVPNLAAVAESSFSVEKLKQAVGSLSTDQLKDLAGKLVEAIQSKEGLVKGLKDQISKISVSDISKASELTKSLESSTNIIKDLKSKLQVVVDKLKAGGVDVSSYTKFLGA